MAGVNKVNGGGQSKENSVDDPDLIEGIEPDFEDEEAEEGLTPDQHRQHFMKTLQSVLNIKASGLTAPPVETIQHLFVNLPEPDDPRKTKTIVFDMDETLIHCVDDCDTDNPDVIIPIEFEEEPAPINAGINIRPYVKECLELANQLY